MSEYTLEQLLATDREKLTQICAEVCYGGKIFTESYDDYHGLKQWKFKDKSCIPIMYFQPLVNTEKGKSQAFDLAVKFDCFPNKLFNMRMEFPAFTKWVVENLTDECLTVEHNNPQTAIVIASILTAQQEKTNDVP